MPRFYFDIRENGTFFEDEEGQELPDLSAAEREAAKAVADIGRDRLPEGESITIGVRDETGENLVDFTVSMTVTRPPPPHEGALGTGVNATTQTKVMPGRPSWRPRQS